MRHLVRGPNWAFTHSLLWPPVCENCFELDATVFGVAIILDMVLTVFVMVITYWCTKKRREAAFPHTPKGKIVLHPQPIDTGVSSSFKEMPLWSVKMDEGPCSWTKPNKLPEGAPELPRVYHHSLEWENVKYHCIRSVHSVVNQLDCMSACTIVAAISKFCFCISSVNSQHSFHLYSLCKAWSCSNDSLLRPISQVFDHTYFCRHLLAAVHPGGRAPPVPSPDYEVGIETFICFCAFSWVSSKAWHNEEMGTTEMLEMSIMLIDIYIHTHTCCEKCK